MLGDCKLQSMHRGTSIYRESDENNPYTVCSRQWWHDGDQHDSISVDAGANTNGEVQITLMSQSDGKCSNITMAEYTGPPSQLDFLGPSIASASHSYANPYYVGGVAANYALQPLVQSHYLGVQSHYLGVQSSRMALPLAIAEESVYVNAKQYHGIMRRRQSRAKAELERKLIKERKPYLHESRHLHAMRRARGSGGRFVNTKKIDTSSASSNTRPDHNSYGATLLARSTNTSSSGTVHSNFSMNEESSEASIHNLNNMQQMFSCGNPKLFSSHSWGFQLSPYR